MTKYLKGVSWGIMIFCICMPLGAEEEGYDSGGRRDPFSPLIGAGSIVKYETSTEAGTSDFNIDGIVYDPKGGSIVLINGESYREGEEVQGAHIISIFQDRVILHQKEEEKVLWIREELAGTNQIKGSSDVEK